MKLLTEEQLRRVDEIIQDNIHHEIHYVFDDEDSIPEIDVNGTIKNAARAVRAYLATLEQGAP